MCLSLPAVASITATLQSPNGGETYRPGSTQVVKWDTTGIPQSMRWTFQIGQTKDGPWTDLTGLANVKDSGSTRGTVQWRVPGVNTTSWYLRMVSATNPEIVDLSDAPFTIQLATPIHVDSTLRGDITGTITLDHRKVYGLDGYVFVNGTLIIEPGTIIVGDTVGQNSVLCINRGAKIIANGTNEHPIVFTSRAAPGQRARGDWGGIVLCGFAGINTPGGEAQIEGGIADATPGRGWYGGNDDADNSGVLRYVRIEFAGIAVLPNNELNGLTCGGVGNGTTIEYVQVSHSNDDAIECFGGTVNLKHIITYGTLDDDFDTDNGYRGNIQFGLVKRFRFVADQSTSQAIESDNDSKGSYNTPRTSPIYSNLTIIGPMKDTSWQPGNGATSYNSRYGAAMQIRRAALTSVYNSVIVGFPRGIEIAQVPTMTAAQNDTLAVRCSDWYGWKYSWLNLAGGSPPDGMSGEWIAKTEYANNSNAKDPNNAHITEAWAEDLSFNPMPRSSAPYLTTARWDVAAEHHSLGSNFFTQVSYRGAFSDLHEDRWDLPWANYDPVNSDYVPVSVNETPSITVSSANRVIPNPTSHASIFQYTLQSAGIVTVKVHNSLGEEVCTLVSSVMQTPGVHEVEIPAQLLGTGMYYVSAVCPNSHTSTAFVVSR